MSRRRLILLAGIGLLVIVAVAAQFISWFAVPSAPEFPGSTLIDQWGWTPIDGLDWPLESTDYTVWSVVKRYSVQASAEAVEGYYRDLGAACTLSEFGPDVYCEGQAEPVGLYIVTIDTERFTDQRPLEYELKIEWTYADFEE